MELAWPLVGRSEELDRVDRVIRSPGRSPGGGVILAGAAGVGKTRLATESLVRAEAAGYLPLRASATSATSALPFGAFAHLLPDKMSAPNRTNLLGQVARSIVEKGGGRPVAIMVDDAHLLDDSSAALTHHLVQAGNVLVLATLRSGAPASDAVIALWKDGLVERIEVAPLGPAQVEELLSAALDGPMEGSSRAQFTERARGNALFLRELVLGALGTGALHRTSVGWRLTGELPISLRLAEIVEGRLSNLSDDERRALGVIAIGEPLAVDTFRALEPSFDIEALESKGLVNIERHDRRLLLRVGHPLHGEVLRSKLSQLTIRSTSARLADAVEGFGARRRTDVLAVGVWRLQGGGPIRPELMLGAAMTARQRNDFALAERLARAAIDAGAGFEASVLLGQLMWAQRRSSEAARHLEALVPQAVTDEQKVLLATNRIELIDLGLNDFETSLRVAEEAEQSIDDSVLRDQITAERGRALGRHGRNAAAVALIDPLIDRSTGRALIAACFAAGTSMPVTGQFSRGVEAIEKGYRAHLAWDGPPMGFPPVMHQALLGHCYNFAGYLAEAEEVSTDFYNTAVSEHSDMAVSFFAVNLSTAALFRGRGRTVLRWAHEAHSLLEKIGFPIMERIALVLVIGGHALLGEIAEARRTLAQVDALGVPASDHAGPVLLICKAWVEVASGDIARAVDHLHDAVEMARGAGAGAYESWALHELARLDKGAEVAPALRELCSRVEGPFTPARAAHAEALASQDAAALDRSSQDFERIGAFLVAAEATSDAAMIWRRSGDPRRATASERRAGELAARCEGARTPALSTAAPVRAALTARELEIAILAASGMADKQIAQKLFLSHRTVENKLHSVYEKMGVKGRSELAEVLRGL